MVAQGEVIMLLTTNNNKLRQQITALQEQHKAEMKEMETQCATYQSEIEQLQSEMKQHACTTRSLSQSLDRERKQRREALIELHNRRRTTKYNKANSNKAKASMLATAPTRSKSLTRQGQYKKSVQKCRKVEKHMDAADLKLFVKRNKDALKAAVAPEIIKEQNAEIKALENNEKHILKQAMLQLSNLVSNKTRGEMRMSKGYVQGMSANLSIDRDGRDDAAAGYAGSALSM